MLIYSRVLRSVPVAIALLLGAAAGTAHAETTSETNPTQPATVVIVDPLDGAVFDAPASFNVRIESEDGNSDAIAIVRLEIDGEPVGTTCNMSGVCNVEVTDLAAGTHTLVAIVEAIGEFVVSDPVLVTVDEGAGTESTSATGSESTAGTEPGASGGEVVTSGDEVVTTGGEMQDSETGGSETGGGEAGDEDLVGKGCTCVSGGGNDPVALGVLLVGGALVRRRRA